RQRAVGDLVQGGRVVAAHAGGPAVRNRELRAVRVAGVDAGDEDATVGEHQVGRDRGAQVVGAVFAQLQRRAGAVDGDRVGMHGGATAQVQHAARVDVQRLVGPAVAEGQGG